MMRGLVVAGPRPSQEVAAQIKNADIEDASRLGVELLARLASRLGQRRLTHRNPDLRVTSIDQRGTPIPAVRGTEIERQGSTLCRPSQLPPEVPALAPKPTSTKATGIGRVGIERATDFPPQSFDRGRLRQEVKMDDNDPFTKPMELLHGYRLYRVEL
jgi:hypothetical protein